MASLLRDVWDSIFNPTTVPQAGVLKLMNMAFYALFFVLFCMAILTGGNIHVLALGSLAIGLFASMKWFLSELVKIDQEKKEKKESSNGNDDDTQQVHDSQTTSTSTRDDNNLRSR